MCIKRLFFMTSACIFYDFREKHDAFWISAVIFRKALQFLRKHFIFWESASFFGKAPSFIKHKLFVFRRFFLENAQFIEKEKGFKKSLRKREFLQERVFFIAGDNVLHDILPKSTWTLHSASPFFINTFYMVHSQNVRFQNVRFQNVRFQNVWNVRFTKRQVCKTSGLQNGRLTRRQVLKMSGCKKTSIYILYLWLVEIRWFCCSHVCRQSDGCVLFSILEDFLPYITIVASNK